jgi:hypothetical protein
MGEARRGLCDLGASVNIDHLSMLAPLPNPPHKGEGIMRLAPAIEDNNFGFALFLKCGIIPQRPEGLLKKPINFNKFSLNKSNLCQRL